MARAKRSAMRRAATAIAVAIALVNVLVAGALVLFHESVLSRALEWAARSTTGAEVTVGGPFHLEALAPFRFEARDVTVSTKSGSGRLDRVSAEIRLRPLLEGKIHFARLALSGARVIAHAPGAAPARRRVRLPVIEDLEIEDAHLELAGTGGAPSALEIARLAVKSGDNGTFRAEGKGTFDDAAWRMDGQFGTVAELLDPGIAFPVSARLELPERAFTANASGSIEDPFAGRGVALDVQVAIGDVAWLAEKVAPGTALSGSLEASGHLQGEFGALGVTKLKAHLRDGEQLSVAVAGDVENLVTIDGLGLDVEAEVSEPALLGALGLGALPGIDSARARTRVTGGPGRYRLQDLEATVAGADARAIEVRGEINLPRLSPPAPGFQLRITLSATVPAADLVGWTPGLAGSGRVKLQTEAAGGGDGLSLEQFVLELTGTSPVAGTLSGRVALSSGWLETIGDVASPGTGARLRDKATFDLAADVSGDLAGTAKLLAVDAPPWGSFTAAGKVSGASGRIDLANLDARLNPGGRFRARLRGQLDLVRGDDAAWSPGTVALAVEASGLDASHLPTLAFVGAVGAGAWQASGKIANRGTALTVPELHYAVGQEDAVRIELTGKIATLGPLGPRVFSSATGVVASVRMAASGTSQLGKAFHHDWPDLGQVEGRFDAALDADGWKLRGIDARLFGIDGLELHASGSASRFPGDPDLALEIEAHTQDPSASLARLGVTLALPGPASLAGKLTGGSAKLSFDGRLGLGPTELTGQVQLDASAARPRAVVSLATDEIDSGDGGWLHDSLAAISDTPTGGDSSAVKKLFGDKPLDLAWLDPADFDVTFEAKALRSGSFHAGPLKLHAVNAQRKASFNLDELGFESGKLVASAVLDASRSPPELSVTGRGQAVSLGALHARLAPNANRIEGTYAFDLDLHAIGHSAHELASTARGHYGHIVAGGRLPGGDLDLLALRPLVMVLGHANAKDHTRVDCTVIELRVVDGVATTESLFLRTGKMLVAGTGRIDLASETVDLVVHTKPTEPGLLDLFKGKHAARVHGPITDLQLDADVSSVVVSAAMESGLLGAAAMNPPVFAAVIGIEFLEHALKSKQVESCHR